MADGIGFQGTQFNLTDTAGTEVTAVGAVTGINGPNGRAAVIDMTHSLSPAKEKMMGLQDNGELSLAVNFWPGDAGQEELFARKENLERAGFQIVFAGETTAQWDFEGYCNQFAINGQQDDKWNGDVNLVIDGAIVRT